MLFAADPDAASLGTAVQVFFYASGGVAAIVVAVASAWGAFWKHSDSDDAYAFKSELKETKLELQEEIKEVRRRLHDFRGHIHAVNLRIVWLMSMMTQVAKKLDLAVPPEPTISTQDEA